MCAESLLLLWFAIMNNRHKMPSAKRITEYWAENMPDNLNDGQIIDDQCFACGYSGQLQRCHITPLCIGGSNDANNLHNLCVPCHRQSEHLDGESYWLWYEEKITNDFDFGLKGMMPKINAALAKGKRDGITDPEQIVRNFFQSTQMQ